MTEYPPDIVDLAIERACAQARDNFSSFRRLMRPDLKWGWWTQILCDELQQFYLDLVAGRRPKLAVEAPPQHGKSLALLDFIAWVAGKNPHLKTIFASYSVELGERTNLDLQRLIRSPRYVQTFGRTHIGGPRWQCNTSLIEYENHKGSFRNTTVDGQVNGMELNLGVIDDPVKGTSDAGSKLKRDKIWDWFIVDFMSRFAADGGLLIIMTRWHVDDLIGRASIKYADLRVLRYPAIAEHDEAHRRKGEALFPEHKPLDFLHERKNVLPQHSWEALYQQNPMIVGGGQLPIEQLKVVLLEPGKIIASVRYWDKAGSTRENADFTAGVFMHRLNDGTFAIEHIARGRWSALEREQRIKMLAEADSRSSKNLKIIVEQEPGSGGKESAESTIRNLAGFRVYADRVTGSKQVRAGPFAAQVQAGNIHLVEGGWNQDFRDECEAWPNGRYNDQVDAAVGAFNKLVETSDYILDYTLWAY